MNEQKPARRVTVAVIGDGNLSEESSKYSLAREVGTRLVDGGYLVVTGGLGGVMEASSRGARESARWQPGTVIGVLPGCDPAEANRWVDVVIPTGLDHARNSIVVQADAVIAIGGGAGTLAEIAFAWMHYRLIVALRVDGWSGRLADQRLDDRVRYVEVPDDRVFGAETAVEAVGVIDARITTYNRRHAGIRRR